ncbi:MAG TPA: hypothetical protein VF326_15315 [Anaerolineaceae bacterium]
MNRMRTTSRFGRRSPWILTGMITTIAGLMVLVNNHNIITLAIGCFLVQFFGNMLMASYPIGFQSSSAVRPRLSLVWHPHLQ